MLKMRAAASDALVQRTLHPPRIPRKPAASGQSAGSSTARSGQASTSGASQAQKQSASSSPSGQSGQRKKKGKGKAPFSSSSRCSGRSGGSSPSEGWRGCLSLHWRQWQAIGAETWVVTVLRDGYRVPFTDSPPPLARTLVSFPMYRAGSPRAQALRQEVEAMLAKGALEIAEIRVPAFTVASSWWRRRLAAEGL